MENSLMSKGVFRISVLCLAYWGIFSIGCSASRQIAQSALVAQKGQEITQEGLDIYAQLLALSYQDKAWQDRIKVLTSPQGASAKLPDSPLQDLSAQINPRQEAWQSWYLLYQQWSVLSKPNYADQMQENLNQLNTRLQDLKLIPPISPSFQKITHAWFTSRQARRLPRYQNNLLSICQQYHRLWDLDKPRWEALIHRVYSDYALALSSIPAEKYNLSLLRLETNEPFADSVLVLQLYRLSQREKLMQAEKEFISRLDKLSNALAELEHVHIHLTERKTEFKDIIPVLNQIEILLTPPNHGNTTENKNR